MVVGEVDLTLTKTGRGRASATVGRSLSTVASLGVVGVLSRSVVAVALTSRASLAGAASAASAITGSSVRSLAASH